MPYELIEGNMVQKLKIAFLFLLDKRKCLLWKVITRDKKKTQYNNLKR